MILMVGFRENRHTQVLPIGERYGDDRAILEEVVDEIIKFSRSVWKSIRLVPA